MVQTDEPTFDVEELFNELFPEPNYFRMETPNASHQEDELIGMEESYQVAKPTSDENSNMSRNPEITFGYGSVADPSKYPVEQRFPNTTVSQPDRQHLLYQQLPAQFVDTTNNFPPSAQLNAYLTDNQRQKQQTLFRNMSPSFTTRSQESCTSDAQQGMGMELQLISRQWQMENALNMQNQFPQSQNVRLAHPMKSENDPRHFLQGPPRGGPFEAPWESTTQVKKATSSDWVEDAIHQIRHFKDIYLTDVVTLYNRARELRNQTQDPRTVLDCEHAMHISKSTHTFLHMSRADIFRDGKDIFPRGMNCLSVSVDRIRLMNSGLMKHQLKTVQLQQRGSVPKFYSTSPSLVQSGLSSEPGSAQVGSSSNYALSSSPHNNSSLTGL